MPCGHCGSPAPLEDTAKEVVEQGNYWVEGLGTDITWTRWWILQRCLVCQRPTLSEIIWTDEFGDPSDEPRRVYPTPRDNDALPTRIRELYDKALRVKPVDPAFYAVGIRRMLEAVCQEQGVAGRDLEKKLKALADQGLVPGPLGEMAQELRNLGNLGAHNKIIDVSEADVPVIEDFAEAILEYLYRAPDKLAAVRASIARRKAEAAAS